MPDISPVRYTDPAMVRGTAADPVAPRNPYPTGYGAKIPTRYRIQYGTLRWRRVYVMQYGNAGSPYITHSGTPLMLDNDTEHRLADRHAM